MKRPFGNDKGCIFTLYPVFYRSWFQERPTKEVFTYMMISVKMKENQKGDHWEDIVTRVRMGATTPCNAMESLLLETFRQHLSQMRQNHVELVSETV